MPSTTIRGVPYHTGTDVAGAWPETSRALADYLQARMTDRTGDTIPGNQYHDGALHTRGELVASGPNIFAGMTCNGTMTINGETWINAAAALNRGAFPKLAQNVPALASTYLLAVSNDAATGAASIVLFNGAVIAMALQSSARYKTVAEGPPDVPDVCRLQPRAFRWAAESSLAGTPEGERDQLGLIAEDVAGVDSRLVIHDDDGQPVGLNHGALITALIHKVTELQARLDSLEGTP